ncbi:hypothetical protein AWC16_20335 [Mycolicibacter longobardus]|uniref:Uncharacterized protein n=1 Tax=Mycolicibacter longobardus TaxID=1108812 RepID=A0A1X1YAP1_9MYCO|nr:hypothetical protein AWC16_20335 [Mycolicibacter longobardus]
MVVTMRATVAAGRLLGGWPVALSGCRPAIQLVVITAAITTANPAADSATMLRRRVGRLEGATSGRWEGGTSGGGAGRVGATGGTGMSIDLQAIQSCRNLSESPPRCATTASRGSHFGSAAQVKILLTVARLHPVFWATERRLGSPAANRSR